MADWTKVDVALGSAWEAWETAEDQDPDAGMAIVLTYEGSLAAVTTAGFALGTDEEEVGEATGVVRFAQLSALTAVPAVLFMAAGGELRADLDTAAYDVRARATSSSTVDGQQSPDGLWFAEPGSGKIASAAAHTGAGVIVAVIDSGIDYTHPFFLKPGKPNESRILAIWDQGLQATSNADRPSPDLLVSTMSYGRLYGTQQIDEALESKTALGTRDCMGHGTHVAGIAAGRPFVRDDSADPIAGIAPEARIIAVKLLDIERRRYAGTSIDVGLDLALRDAIMFCLRTAKVAGAPIVINCSLSFAHEAGDSRDSLSRWVDRTLDPSRKADFRHFPTGSILVKSAGNEGSEKPRNKAIVVVPESGEIVVPLVIKDSRDGLQERRAFCRSKVFTPSLGVFLWYRAAAPGAVGFSLSLPGQSTFGPEALFAEPFIQAFDYVPGQTPEFVPKPFHARDRFEARLHHTNEPIVRLPQGKSIHRRSATISLAPKTAGDVGVYPGGAFRLRIRAPQGTTFHLFARGDRWASKRVVYFQIPDDPKLDPAIKVTAEASIIDGFGDHAITVASYSDANGNLEASAFHRRADTSGRGPLRDFAKPAAKIPPLAAKPTLSAPGEAITSAASIDGDETLLQPTVSIWYTGERFVDYGGTSMAAPMVAGAIALLLDRNPALNVIQVRDALTKTARPAPDQATAPPGHDPSLGSGMLDAFAAYRAVPPK